MSAGLQTAAHGYSRTMLAKTERPAMINKNKIQVAFNTYVCDMD